MVPELIQCSLFSGGVAEASCFCFAVDLSIASKEAILAVKLWKASYADQSNSSRWPHWPVESQGSRSSIWNSKSGCLGCWRKSDLCHMHTCAVLFLKSRAASTCSLGVKIPLSIVCKLHWVWRPVLINLYFSTSHFKGVSTSHRCHSWSAFIWHFNRLHIPWIYVYTETAFTPRYVSS